jgi:hypothetical protein
LLRSRSSRLLRIVAGAAHRAGLAKASSRAAKTVMVGTKDQPRIRQTGGGLQPLADAADEGRLADQRLRYPACGTELAQHVL